MYDHTVISWWLTTQKNLNVLQRLIIINVIFPLGKLAAWPHNYFMMINNTEECNHGEFDNMALADIGAGTGTGTGTPIASNTLPTHFIRCFMSLGYRSPMLPILKQLAFESLPGYITWPANKQNSVTPVFWPLFSIFVQMVTKQNANINKK